MHIHTQTADCKITTEILGIREQHHIEYKTSNCVTNNHMQPDTRRSNINGCYLFTSLVFPFLLYGCCWFCRCRCHCCCCCCSVTYKKKQYISTLTSCSLSSWKFACDSKQNNQLGLHQLKSNPYIGRTKIKTITKEVAVVVVMVNNTKRIKSEKRVQDSCEKEMEIEWGTNTSTRYKLVLFEKWTHKKTVQAIDNITEA